MAKKLFIGSLDWNTTTEELSAAFSVFGELEDAVVIFDRETGRSKGFGFVTFVNDADADRAIEEMHNATLGRRQIIVNEARPPEPRGDRGPRRPFGDRPRREFAPRQDDFGYEG
ncbi:MAG TPA: RNA-binding protein [bacterium]|nr:RNA-binding protein [bacterium]